MIDVGKDLQTAYDDGYREGKRDAQRWIPCKERLPEEGEYYLVTRQYFGWNCTEYREIDIAKSDFNEWGKANVIAWCELPEPYKEESDD